MSAAGRKARSSRSPHSNQALALIVAAAAAVALLLAAIIAWTIFQEFREVSGQPAMLPRVAQGIEGSDLPATGDLGPLIERATQAAMAPDRPGSVASQMRAIGPKNIVAGSGAIRARWTATPPPTRTPTPSPTPFPTFVSELSESAILPPLGLAPAEKWIDVNVASQTLVAYEGGLPVFQTLVSTGKAQYPTVIGQFRIWLRFRSQDMNGYRLGYDYYLRNVPYVQYFYQDYALHGTFWHSNFGTPMSHGCVNLPTPAAEWLFNWAEYGTLVNVHG
jgi:lipoprotein-anchoring transpeptidase ErfK/SrfK